MPDVPSRLQGHTINACPHCGRRHRFALELRVPAKPLLFAGPESPDALKEITVDLLCPVTRKTFQDKVTIAKGEEFLRIADPFANQAVPPATTSAEVDDGSEYAAWVRASRQTALDHCRTMLTTASAAIPVHFAVVGYLGASTANSPTAKFAVVPAVLYLASVAVFAYAQRPRLTAADAEDFTALRTRVLRRLGRLSTVGLTLFVCGLGGSVAVFTALLARSG